ncbi:transcriptional regulator, GntR family [Amphibacillus marinus]|uniref:Transcriptional regulator, GntR family n=1 Tax=Amphibacillus marinus TaxID=872970 RepID=A0A1H8QT55_9BACI|nr:GntR family transcriptional regulator [Amphibacillus marinus]SEO57355.1 transcriptional regulator, GntR family [Amphibacillus marinus]
MINKNSPIPIYYQIEEYIKKKIIAEELMPGDALSSEREFAEQFNISRMTVRQAINNMVNDGLLFRQKGRGTFVAEQKIEQDLSSLTSFSEDMRKRNQTPSNQLISIQLINHQPAISEKLRVGSNEPIYEIKRLRLADDEPIALETTYTPEKIVGHIDEKQAEQSFYTYIEEQLQLDISYGLQTIEASIANKDEMKYLKVKKDDPILLMQRTSYLNDPHQTPIEYVKSAYRADKYKFNMKMKR